jgi:hypothetical protein
MISGTASYRAQYVGFPLQSQIPQQGKNQGFFKVYQIGVGGWDGMPEKRFQPVHQKAIECSATSDQDFLQPQVLQGGGNLQGHVLGVGPQKVLRGQGTEGFQKWMDVLRHPFHAQGFWSGALVEF